MYERHTNFRNSERWSMEVGVRIVATVEKSHCVQTSFCVWGRSGVEREKARLCFFPYSHAIFFFFNFFDVDHFKNLYWICCNITSVVYVLWFGHEACRILAPHPGIEPTPPELEGGILTTELPGKSQDAILSWQPRVHRNSILRIRIQYDHIKC